ncbi:acyltransferase family protein [Parvibaculum sp.]|uniref:acyltransferase family protein n=1 Tax=Parvibaculum sp. TaxID=2024848 RepID=UPI0034A0A2BA
MKKLETIEAGRAIAALSVVFFHANAGVGFVFGDAHMTNFFVWGDRGVDFFFVLSGFIIGHVHGGDVGKPSRLRSYALKRAIRIFPILWLVAGSWIVLKHFSGTLSPSSEVVITSLFLLPSLERPEPLVVWTLRHEILFYAMFAVLIASRSAGITIALIWLVGCFGQFGLLLLDRGFSGLTAMILSTFQLQFAIGLTAAWAYKKVTLPSPRLSLLVAFGVVTIVVVASTILGAGRSDTLDYVSVGATVWVLVFGISLGLLVFSLAACGNVLSVPRWLVFLGGASYAIYLIHVPAISVAQRALAPLLPEALVQFGVAHLIFIGVGVAAGCALHVAFERPITQFLRDRYLARSTVHVR